MEPWGANALVLAGWLPRGLRKKLKARPLSWTIAKILTRYAHCALIELPSCCLFVSKALASETNSPPGELREYKPKLWQTRNECFRTERGSAGSWS
jgi:hypothetical protein